MDKGKILAGKRSFLNQARLFLNAREKVRNFKSKLFPRKSQIKTSKHKPKPDATLKLAPEPEPQPAKCICRICSSKLYKQFLNEIKNEEKNVNEQMFREYFQYHVPSFLVKDLYEDNQIKSDIIVK